MCVSVRERKQEGCVCICEKVQSCDRKLVVTVRVMTQEVIHVTWIDAGLVSVL